MTRLEFVLLAVIFYFHFHCSLSNISTSFATQLCLESKLSLLKFSHVIQFETRQPWAINTNFRAGSTTEFWNQIWGKSVKGFMIYDPTSKQIYKQRLLFYIRGVPINTGIKRRAWNCHIMKKRNTKVIFFDFFRNAVNIS